MSVRLKWAWKRAAVNKMTMGQTENESMSCTSSKGALQHACADYASEK